jgi:hypothetical protein
VSRLQERTHYLAADGGRLCRDEARSVPVGRCGFDLTGTPTLWDSSMDDPIGAQLIAYNDHDIDGFVACYAEDTVVTSPDGTITTAGSAQMRAEYGTLFENWPDLRTEVQDQVHAGAWTVHEERVSRSGQALVVLVAYEVRDGKICRVIMLR